MMVRLKMRAIPRQMKKKSLMKMSQVNMSICMYTVNREREKEREREREREIFIRVLFSPLFYPQ